MKRRNVVAPPLGTKAGSTASPPATTQRSAAPKAFVVWNGEAKAWTPPLPPEEQTLPPMEQAALYGFRLAMTEQQEKEKVAGELRPRRNREIKRGQEMTKDRLKSGRAALVREYLRPFVERMARDGLKVSEIVRAMNSPGRLKDFREFWKRRWSDPTDDPPPERIDRKRIRTILGK